MKNGENSEISPIAGRVVIAATPKTGILKKIVAVQSRCTAIQRNGENTHFRYKYYKLEDILAMLNPLLNAEGLSIFHSVTDTVWDAANGMVIVTMQHVITDAETGDYVTLTYTGTGRDEPAKGGGVAIGSKAIYKAITTTTRYFYMGTFRIADHLDEDSDGTEPSREDTKPTAFTQQKTNVVAKKVFADFSRKSPLYPVDLREEIARYKKKPLNLSESERATYREEIKKAIAWIWPDAEQRETALQFLTGSPRLAGQEFQVVAYLAEYLERDKSGKLREVVIEELRLLNEHLDGAIGEPI